MRILRTGAVSLLPEERHCVDLRTDFGKGHLWKGFASELRMASWSMMDRSRITGSGLDSMALRTGYTLHIIHCDRISFFRSGKPVDPHLTLMKKE